jgi:hypothetical protein
LTTNPSGDAYRLSDRIAGALFYFSLDITLRSPYPCITPLPHLSLIHTRLIMAVPVPSAQFVVEKWKRRAAGATQDYTAGVQTPSVDWAAAARAAEPNYKAAVTAAAAAGKFGQGVQRAGTQTWQKGAVEKGSVRWAPGIEAGSDKFGAGISSVLATVGALSLPPRGVKGDPRNLERVRLVADALHRKAQPPIIISR